MMQILEAVFSIFSKSFWLFAIIVTATPIVIYGKILRHYIHEHPELASGYKGLFWGYISVMNIPWVVMGIGSTIGRVPSVWHFFNPREGNPYVLAWFGSVILALLIITFWLFLKNGDKTLMKHRALLNLSTKSIVKIKLTWLLVLLISIIGMALMWIGGG